MAIFGASVCDDGPARRRESEGELRGSKDPEITTPVEEEASDRFGVRTRLSRVWRLGRERGFDGERSESEFTGTI